MIDRGNDLKIPLRALCNNEKALDKLQINDDECKMLKKINKVLANFKRATEYISATYQLSIFSCRFCENVWTKNQFWPVLPGKDC